MKQLLVNGRGRSAVLVPQNTSRIVLFEMYPIPFAATYSEQVGEMQMICSWVGGGSIICVLVVRFTAKYFPHSADTKPREITRRLAYEQVKMRHSSSRSERIWGEQRKGRVVGAFWPTASTLNREVGSLLV